MIPRGALQELAAGACGNGLVSRRAIDRQLVHCDGFADPSPLTTFREERSVVLKW